MAAPHNGWFMPENIVKTPYSLADLQVTSQLLLAGWVGTHIDLHVSAGHSTLPPSVLTNPVLKTC